MCPFNAFSGVCAFKPSVLSYLYNLSRLNRKSWEVSSSVNWYRFSKNRVQTLHLLPRQHTEPPTLLRRITGGHGYVKADRATELFLAALCDVLLPFNYGPSSSAPTGNMRQCREISVYSLSCSSEPTRNTKSTEASQGS